MEGKKKCSCKGTGVTATTQDGIIAPLDKNNCSPIANRSLMHSNNQISLLLSQLGTHM